MDIRNTKISVAFTRCSQTIWKHFLFNSQYTQMIFRLEMPFPEVENRATKPKLSGLLNKQN